MVKQNPPPPLQNGFNSFFNKACQLLYIYTPCRMKWLRYGAALPALRCERVAGVVQLPRLLQGGLVAGDLGPGLVGGHGVGLEAGLQGDGQGQLLDAVHGGAGHDGSAAQLLQRQHWRGEKGKYFRDVIACILIAIHKGTALEKGKIHQTERYFFFCLFYSNSYTQRPRKNWPQARASQAQHWFSLSVLY